MKRHRIGLLAAFVAVLGFLWSMVVPPAGAQAPSRSDTVFALGDAGFYGSTGGISAAHPLVGMAATPSGHGYWLVASDGGVFAFGDAHFYGSMGGVALARPVVGMAATPSGNGYWLAASDGGVFTFGDAHFYGSMGGKALAGPVSGIASTPSGYGYWLVGADGGVFNFGNAGFYGSVTGLVPGRQVVGIEPTPTGAGYWLVAATVPVVTPTTRTVGVNVYFSRAGTDCSAVYPLARSVTPPQVLAGAMSALLAGPTATEKASGYSSFFSSATAGMLNWAHVDASGLARIDFANFSSIIPNASTSCGSQALLSALNHTATQFASVKSAVYSFDGSVSAFYLWLQLVPPSAPAATTPVLSSALGQASTQEHTLAATYGNVIATLGQVRPFTNALAAEEQHIATVAFAAANHQVTLPAGPFPGQTSPTTLTAACRLGAGLEQATVGLYSQLIPQVAAWADVTSAFTNLQAAASSHLAAFQSCS